MKDNPFDFTKGDIDRIVAEAFKTVHKREEETADAKEEGLSEYTVNVSYEQGTTLTIKAASRELAGEKAEEILAQTEQGIFPDECKPEIVHRVVSIWRITPREEGSDE